MGELNMYLFSSVHMSAGKSSSKSYHVTVEIKQLMDSNENDRDLRASLVVPVFSRTENMEFGLPNVSVSMFSVAVQNRNRKRELKNETQKSREKLLR
jgi:hypothetical protein